MHPAKHSSSLLPLRHRSAPHVRLAITGDNLTVKHGIRAIESIDWNIHAEDEHPTFRCPPRRVDELRENKTGAVLVSQD